MKFKQWIALLLAVVAITFAACDDDDEDSGSGQVVLEAFGPSPALRGSDLTFIGKNMDQVTAVILPDNIEITDIDVISSEKIKVTIPQNAVEGYAKLQTSNGVINSKTLLKYIEPISISKISPNPVKAGETLTIEGDYLNLIQKVIFADDVTVMVKDFTTWERAKIQLVVPLEAQTGTIILADTAAMPVELESEVELLVTLPSVTEIAELPNKKPGDAISIVGADLDLAQYVVLANKDSIDFTIENSTLSFSLPSGTTDGEINMVAFSGVNVHIANVTMAVPTELVADLATGLRGGNLITISGVNMDLVTTVVFPGVTDAVTPESIAADKITVLMPDVAISGNLTLNTASGNTTAIAIETQKPEVTAYNPSPVSAGSDVTLDGTNLDLVVSVTFADDLTVEVSPSSATSLTLTVPVDAESGVVVLTMANGETVEASSLTVQKPEFCYIPVLPNPETEINAGTVLTLDVKNEDKLTDVQVNSVSTQYILQGTILYVLIPGTAGGDTELTLVSSNGSVSYTISVIGSGTTETVIMSDIHDLGTWTGEADGGAFRLYKSSFADVPAGSTLKFYFTVTGFGQMQINDANWAQQGSIVEFSDVSQTSYEMELTSDFLDHILNTNDGWSETALIIQGQNLIISKVSIVTTGGSSGETVIMGDTHDLGTWTGEADGGAFRLYKESFADVPTGSTLKFYFTVTGSGQLQINDANWAQQGEILEFSDTSQTFYEMELTSDFLDHILNTSDGWSETALVIQGQDLIISKVSVITK